MQILLFVTKILSESLTLIPEDSIRISDQVKPSEPYTYFFETENGELLSITSSNSKGVIQTELTSNMESIIYPNDLVIHFDIKNEGNKPVEFSISTTTTKKIEPLMNQETGEGYTVELEYALREKIDLQEKDISKLKNFQKNLEKLKKYVTYLIFFEILFCIVVIYVMHSGTMKLFNMTGKGKSNK